MFSYSSGSDYAEVREPAKQVLGRSISPREVALQERIGEGQFGDVHKGVLHPGVSGGREGVSGGGEGGGELEGGRG